MRVKVNTQGTNAIVSVGIQGPSGPIGPSSAINNSSDVDTTNLQDGSVLVYYGTTDKWTATKLLNNQDMDAGEF